MRRPAGDLRRRKSSRHEQHPDGLRVTFPQEKPCEFAYGLKIRMTGHLGTKQ